MSDDKTTTALVEAAAALAAAARKVDTTREAMTQATAAHEAAVAAYGEAKDTLERVSSVAAADSAQRIAGAMGQAPAKRGGRKPKAA